MHNDDMTDGSPNLNRKSVLDDLSSIMSDLNVSNPFNTQSFYSKTWRCKRNYMGLGMMTMDDPPAPKEVGTVLDNGTKLRLNKQCLKIHREFLAL